MWRYFLVLMLLCLSACSTPVDVDEAEHAVPEFHLALMGADFAGIYRRADAGLRAQQSETAFVARLQQQMRALGEVRGADRVAAQVNGREATLTYRTVYAAGTVEEVFVIRQAEGAPPRLLAYRLQTPLPAASAPPAP